MRVLLPAFLSLLIVAPLRAQDTLEVVLPPVRVEASRGSFSSGDAPAAIAVEVRGPERRAVEPALALEDVLTELPGLWIADRSHFAIGERLVVRGLGSRAAFGVRSVAVLLDGVLLTMPDGQAVLDPVEPSVLARAELLRGPASRFWGNAAGGVLALESEAPGEAVSQSVRILAGSHGSRQLTGRVGIAEGRQKTSAFASVLDQTGFREHADGRMARVGLRTTRALDSGAVVAFSIAASDLDTRSPGSLTAEQWEADPAAADARYINTSSGKQATQIQSSLGLTAPLYGGILSTSLFALQRSLDNPLPFAWVGLERLAFGMRADWRVAREGLEVGVGVDTRRQADDRINTNNADGGRGDNLRLDQRETVTGSGASALATWNGPMTVTAGLRVDRLTVRLEDHLVSNGDDSGKEAFFAASPSLGVRLDRGATTLFASVSTAFEIPTTTELVNNPDGNAGFNQNLEPQRITGLEFGLRHVQADLDLDLAAYSQTLTNFLSPYQLESAPGRTFYRNVGEVAYMGLEGRARVRLTSWVAMVGTASLQRFEFASGTLDGNRVPGIPMRFGSLRLDVDRSGTLASVRIRAAGAQMADDANTVEIDGFVSLDVRVARTGLVIGNATVAPFLEIRNLGDANYVVSIIPNARGGRYYEGLPGRNLRGGFSLTF
ncbi:MAG: TonB-dependent receptor [Rhodothermales bacterium]|nr:TonB-dependent receptor [Rhodothermales bacterium]MBO6780556.1 TonB-dependent receptor [Rhodothermales bacterium]